MIRHFRKRSGRPKTATAQTNDAASRLGRLGSGLLTVFVIAAVAISVAFSPGILPARDDVSFFGAAQSGETGEGGHFLGWNPRVVADSSEAEHPRGTRMPCDSCHGVHALPTGTVRLLVHPLDPEKSIDGARSMCTACHRPSDSLESTPTVFGLELFALAPGVEAHLDASEHRCEGCHGGSVHHIASHGGGAGCADLSCHGGTGSHAVHVSETDPRGFGGMECEGCHDTDLYPYFASGDDPAGDGRIGLSATDVCDTCHSPGGSYDGVVTTALSVGAKDNWETGVYTEEDTLQDGKERWCAGCHDEEPAVILGVSAPPIVGDESASTGYGRGYGYYITGHGRPTGPYPASQAPPAGIGCTACHDLTQGMHIDGVARTYSRVQLNYQDGYRLRTVDGGVPLQVPRTGATTATAFALCLECHQESIYLTGSDKTTNFRDVSRSVEPDGVNSHARHLESGPGWNDRWDSDWNGVGDSRVSCPACHNVHGSSAPAMTRRGELTGAGSGLNVRYTSAGSAVYPHLLESDAGRMDLPPGPGSVASNGVCSMCHSQSYDWVRTPQDIIGPRLMSAYSAPGSQVVAAIFNRGVFTTPVAGSLIPDDLLYDDHGGGRSITGVGHAPGDDVAKVSLSGSLDETGSIGVDTLAVRTSTSVYDSQGRSAGTQPVIVRLDASPPAVSDLTPAPGTEGLGRSAELSFRIADVGSGADWSTFEVELIGDAGYNRTYTIADDGIVTVSGSRVDCVVTVAPDALYSLGERITVNLTLADLVGNQLDAPAWSFTVSAVPTVDTLVLTPSGLAANPGGYWTVPTADMWDTYLDTHDGDDSYATSDTGPAGAEVHLAMDDTGLPGATTIHSVRLFVYARYVSGWSPTPPSVDGNIDVGYRTGTAIVWTGSMLLPGTGNYILVSSSEYTTDSDGGQLTVADVDDLQVALKRLTLGMNPMRATQVYAEVKYTY